MHRGDVAQEQIVSRTTVGSFEVPDATLYVQGWYPGRRGRHGLHGRRVAKELAYFDRGPIEGPPGADVPIAAADTAGRGGRGRISVGGSWGAYYWNGMIYSSEIDRGFDVYELTPSADLSANELAAAKLMTLTEYNPQSQVKPVWPPAFVVVRSSSRPARAQRWPQRHAHAGYLGSALDAAEQNSAARGTALTALAKQVDERDPARILAKFFTC